VGRKARLVRKTQRAYIETPIGKRCLGICTPYNLMANTELLWHRRNIDEDVAWIAAEFG
jgi:hypothetical protein